MREGDEADAITGLRQKTNFGRPDWDKIFGELAQKHPS
jgi:NADPH oxidase